MSRTGNGKTSGATRARRGGAKPAAANKQDLRSHLAVLEADDLLVRVERDICKDTELMPLVRWQFRGLPEEDRKGFLFENLHNARGEKLTSRVAAAIYAGSSEIYARGMGTTVDDVRARWLAAQTKPLKPRVVETGPVHEEVHMGKNLAEHGGVEEFPIPISTPGFDVGPYTTASNWVTKDAETGWHNVGNYRGQVKGPTRMGMFISPRNHGWAHWAQYKERGIDMDAALVIGGPPAMVYCSGSRLPYGTSEYDIAGALIGEPIELVQAKTVDLLVPAYAEIVIEGKISTEFLEPEAPFGEFTGYMGQRVYNAVFEVTAITHRKNPIFTAMLSQLPPSESSKLKQTAQNHNYLHYLRSQCNLPQVVDVTCAEIAVDSLFIIRMRPCNLATQWQALYAMVGRHMAVGKMFIVVDEDIDPNDFESIVWALSYRMQPDRDMKIVEQRGVALDPSGMPYIEGERDSVEQSLMGSAVLINAMRKWKYPPVSLPAKKYMENAKKIWEELGLPKLKPRVPWHGYELGDWSDRDRQEAEWAVKGEYSRTGDRAKQQRKRVDEV